MQQTVQEFFHDFRQEFLAGTEAGSQFQLAEFMESITEELTETGFVEGFDSAIIVRSAECASMDTASMMKTPYICLLQTSKTGMNLNRLQRRK